MVSEQSYVWKKKCSTVLMVFTGSVGKCDSHSIAELRLKGERETVTLDRAQMGLFCEEKKVKTCFLNFPSTCLGVLRNNPLRIEHLAKHVYDTVIALGLSGFKDRIEKELI